MDHGPLFATLNQLLERDEMAIDAAELHGSLCAQASVAGALEGGEWLSRALGRDIDPQRLTADLREALDWLFDWTLAGLNDHELGFRLLLPNDEATIAERAGALARWCGGFVSGYGAAIAGGEHELTPDTGEFLRDLSEIAQADLDLDEGEEQEFAYAELSEYARVGAMLVFDTLRGPAEGEKRH